MTSQWTIKNVILKDLLYAKLKTQSPILKALHNYMDIQMKNDILNNYKALHTLKQGNI